MLQKGPSSQVSEPLVRSRFNHAMTSFTHVTTKKKGVRQENTRGQVQNTYQPPEPEPT